MGRRQKNSLVGYILRSTRSPWFPLRSNRDVDVYLVVLGKWKTLFRSSLFRRGLAGLFRSNLSVEVSEV